MKRADLISIGFLVAAIIIIFFPLFHADYLYADEASLLWFFKKDINFIQWVSQGRYATYLVFSWIFRSIHSVHGVMAARLFSLSGWLVCLPAWYFIIMKVVVNNGLPR